jgi:hypothetical protein
MPTLFISFGIAIGGALSLVYLSKVYDFELFTSKMFPLIPLLYAFVYEIIEHVKGNKGKSASIAKGQATGETPGRPGLDVSRVLMGIGISYAIKFCAETGLVLLFLKVSGQSFSQVYGVFGLETIGTFLRGDHPWFSDSRGVYLLALISLLSCLGTGLWIGYTTKGKAVLEGVITGAGVTVIMSMTNMLALYQRFEEVTRKLADLMGYVLQAGFLVVIALQVLLYGLWSGLVQMGKEERMKNKTGRKPARK